MRKILAQLLDKKPTLWDRLLNRLGIRPLPFQDFKLHNARYFGKTPRLKDQHVIVSQIPDRYRRLPIVSVARNPFDRYVSEYEFRYWIKFPTEPPETLVKTFPEFPDLTFSRFMDYQDYSSQAYLPPGFTLPCEIGPQTLRFINMYFIDVDKTLTQLSDDYFFSGAYKKDMAPVTFLRKESLNEDLYHFLLKHNFQENQLSHILTHERIFPKEGSNYSKRPGWREYFTPELFEKVSYQDRYLLHILKENQVGEPETWHL